MDITATIASLQQNPVFIVLYYTYTVTLKGLALWRAAKNSNKYWFIFMLVFNLLGIPEILYLLYFSKKHFSFSSLIPAKKDAAKK